MYLGLMRVKNEARWIDRVLRSISPLCDRVLLFDDHSTDDTPGIAERMGATVISSPFEGLDEARDKNYLLGKAWRMFARPGDIAVMIDGDEELAAGDDEVIRRDIQSCDCLRLRVLYLWNDEKTVRTDGVYGKFTRPSVFRFIDEQINFGGTGAGCNFHCSNAPHRLTVSAPTSRARLLHYGYLDKQTRIDKYNWYNAKDPGNRAEDGYRHMVIGDIFPECSRFRHAGPLRLETI